MGKLGNIFWECMFLQPNSYSFAVSETQRRVLFGQGIVYLNECALGCCLVYTTYLSLVGSYKQTNKQTNKQMQLQVSFLLYVT